MTTASYTMCGDTTEIVKSGPPGLETIGRVKPATPVMKCGPTAVAVAQ